MGCLLVVVTLTNSDTGGTPGLPDIPSLLQKVPPSTQVNPEARYSGVSRLYDIQYFSTTDAAQSLASHKLVLFLDQISCTVIWAALPAGLWHTTQYGCLAVPTTIKQTFQKQRVKGDMETKDGAICHFLPLQSPLVEQ